MEIINRIIISASCFKLGTCHEKLPGACQTESQLQLVPLHNTHILNSLPNIIVVGNVEERTIDALYVIMKFSRYYSMIRDYQSDVTLVPRISKFRYFSLT